MKKDSLKKDILLEGLTAVKQVCEKEKDCNNCGLHCYCKHRMVYGTPELFPEFEHKMAVCLLQYGKPVYYNMDMLFNTLNLICSRTLLCDECILKEECDSTCGFAITPEYWEL